MTSSQKARLLEIRQAGLSFAQIRGNPRSFVQAVNQIIGNKTEIIHTCEAVLDECRDVEGLAAEHASLQAELEVVTGLM
jgi:hypothetical protein